MLKHRRFMRNCWIELNPWGQRSDRPAGSGGPGRAFAADTLAYGQARDQGITAYRAAPFRAVAVRHVRAFPGLRVKSLEQSLLVASGAVPAQVRHPGDLLVALHHELAGG